MKNNKLLLSMILLSTTFVSMMNFSIQNKINKNISTSGNGHLYIQKVLSDAVEMSWNSASEYNEIIYDVKNFQTNQTVHHSESNINGDDGTTWIEGLNEHTHYLIECKFIFKADNTEDLMPTLEFYTSESAPVFDKNLTSIEWTKDLTTIKWNIIDLKGQTINDSKINSLKLIEVDKNENTIDYDISQITTHANDKIQISNGMSLDGKIIHLVDGENYKWQVSANVSIISPSNNSTPPTSIGVDINSTYLNQYFESGSNNVILIIIYTIILLLTLLMASLIILYFLIHKKNLNK